MVNEIIKERMLRTLKQSILNKWGVDCPYEVLRELYLTDMKGCCMPDKYLGDDVLIDIENKFYYFLDAIRNEFEPFIYVYIIPCYDDATTSLMILDDRLLYKDNMKAWNFWYESEEALINEMYSIYITLLTKLEKSWCCYELHEDDIKAVAEHKGIDLEEIDLEDVIYYIKKAIPWALENRDEIIEEAIHSADLLKFQLGTKIYVGNLGVAKISKEGIDAYYIEESDETKSWQLHFDESRGDTVLKSVKVTPLEPLESQ